MFASDFRAEARKKLNGKWGKGACICLAYILFFFVIEFISRLFPEFITDIITTIIQVPLSFGLIWSFFKLYNAEEVKAFDFLNLGFNNFKMAWGISLRILLKMIIPVILLIVSYTLILIGSIFIITSGSYILGILSIIGFILLVISTVWTIYKSYSYQLAYFIAIDNPEITSKEAVEKSQELMDGKRCKLFCLQFSFMGWFILATLGFGIPLLWIIPYIQFATIAFYKNVTENNSNINAEIIEENND